MASPLPPVARRRRAATSLLALILLGLAGCSSADPSSSPSTSPSTSPSASAPPSSTPPSSAPPSSRAAASGRSYVALGDSYTAAPLVPTTDPAGGCLRSQGNYPQLVAAALGDELDDVSCVGATSSSMIGVQRLPDGSVNEPQFDALGRGTDLVTLGIGGNDVGLFTTLLGTCTPLARQDPTGSPCTDRLAGTPQDLLDAVDDVAPRIEAVVAGVRDRAPRAQVVVVTYPQLVPASGSCEELPLATGDYAYAREVIAALSTAIARGARAAGADVVDALRLSRGHDVCSDEPWVNGAETDPARALALHPFAEEQQAVADAVVTRVRHERGVSAR